MLAAVIFVIAAFFQTLPCETKRHHRNHVKHHFHGHRKSFLEQSGEKRGSVAALPELKVVANAKESGVEFKIGECKVKLSLVDKCKVNLTPSPDTCGGKIPLASILNHFLPKNGLAEKSKTFILPDKFDLKSLEIDKCETTIDFKTSSREKLDLIPGKFSMEGVELALKINYKTGAVDWELVVLDMSASVTLAGKKIPITVKKKAKETFVKFSFKTDEINVPNIVKAFSKKEITPPEADSAVAAKVTGVVIKKASFSGYYDPKGFFEVVASGEPQGTSFKSSSFFVVIQKPEDADVKAAVLAKIDMFSPATLLKDLTGKDFTKIPFIKELLLNVAFAVSNEDFTVIKNEELVKAISGIIKGDKTIEKGMKLYMDVPVREVFKKLAPDLKTDSFPASLFMKVTINKDGVKFKFPDDWKSDLLQILKGLAPKLKEYLPKWLQPSDGPTLVTVKEFSVDFKTMGFNIDVEISGPFKLGSILTLYNISLTASHKGGNNPYDFSFASSQRLFEDIVLSTKLSKKGQTYEFEGSISMISTSQLIKALGVKFLSEETLKKLSYLDFGMRDVKLNAKFGDRFYISLSATVILFGWDKVKCEGLLYYDGDAPVMALGVIIEKIRMDEIVEKLFKKKMAGVTWLTELNVVLTMSNTDATAKTKDLKFENSNLQAVGIKKGVMFRAVATIPTDCKGDKLCEMSKNVTKDEKTTRTLTIEGQITLTGAELKGTYEGHWSLGTNIKIEKIQLILRIGTDTKIFFAVTVAIVKPALELEGGIGIGATGALTLSAKMNGIWENAFGIQYISFGNMAFSIGIIPGVSVTEFAFHGELQLGKSSAAAVSQKQRRAAGNKIVSKAAVGVDVVNPLNNYFYAEVTNFTLSSIAEAFDLNIKLPKALMETGFPDGVIVSFTTSTKGKELAQLKIKIEPGFRFQGKIRILGYDLFVDCTIVPTAPAFALLVEMSPIKIAGGLIALQRSKTETDKGPMLQAKVAAAGVTIKIKAFVTVLGISAGTVIDVSDNGFEFELSGNLFDVVSAELKIKSKYSDIKTASFHVSACLKTGPDEIQKEVKANLDEAGKEATKTMEEAKKKAAGIGDLYLKSKKGVSKMDEEIKDFQDKLRKKGKEISEAKKALNEKCIDECSTVCIGGPDWDPKCLEVDGGFIGCPVWNDCKFKVPNYNCLAECKGKKGVAVMKAAVKQFSLEVLLKILQGIKILFHIGKSFFEESKKLLDVTKQTLKEAAEKLKAGLDAAKIAATTAVENVVKIHSMCFESGLSEAAKACVGLNISATFFKTNKVEFTTQGCLDVSFAKQIAQAIADKLYPGISALKGAIGALKAKFGLIQKEKDHVAESADEAKTACKDDSGDCAASRDIIWTTEENYYRKLAYEQLPRFTLKDQATLNAFEKDTASVKAANDNPMVKANIPIKSDVDASKKEQISDLNTCGQFSKRFEAVEGTVNTMKNLVDLYKKQNGKFKKAIKSRKNKINRLGISLRSECLYFGCKSETLNDALFYVGKAKNEINKWAQTVESQVKKQDSQTFGIWKKQLDFHMEQTKGEGLSKYLEAFTAVGEKLHARMGITKHDAKAESLRGFSQAFADLLQRDVSISEAIPTIERLSTDIAEIKAMSTECNNSEDAISN